MGLIDSGMGWAIFGSAFIFIFILLGIFAESQRQKRKLARQELLQKERFMAMEKGLPIPEWESSIVDEEGAPFSSAEAYERKKQAFRLVTFALGFFFTFTGLGMLLAFNLAPGDDWKDVATVGAIPVMAGVGLLLFYYLTRNRPS